MMLENSLLGIYLLKWKQMRHDTVILNIEFFFKKRHSFLITLDISVFYFLIKLIGKQIKIKPVSPVSQTGLELVAEDDLELLILPFHFSSTRLPHWVLCNAGDWPKAYTYVPGKLTTELHPHPLTLEISISCHCCFNG